MKRGLFSGILLFVLLCCGCGKEELEENRKNFSELISVYPEEKMKYILVTLGLSCERYVSLRLSNTKTQAANTN